MTKAALRHDPAAVADFMNGLDHPLKTELEKLRQLILGVHPDIGEGIKWNAPSFHLHDHFATANLRASDHLLLVLHTGAKVKNLPVKPHIDDPSGLLTWHATDRASIKLANMRDLTEKSAALTRILDQWVAFMRKVRNP